MKPEARVINVARGGIVDEDALVRALKDGLIAGAAVDVYEKEPPGHHALFDLEQVVVTPHLGASTEEAQTKAGTAIAEQVLLALRGEFAPYAVNVAAGGDFGEALRPFIPLTERLGRVLGGLAGSGLSAVRIEVYGAIAYYLANQAEIDTYLIRQNEKWAEGKRNAEPLPADLRERLMRARDELHTARPS